MSTHTRLGCLVAVSCCATLLACTGTADSPADAGVTTTPDAGEPDAGPTARRWRFETMGAGAVPTLWGAMVAQASPSLVFLAGGMQSSLGPAVGNLLRVEQTPTGVSVTTVSTGLTPRYCGCAMVDVGRNEVLAIGGRDDAYVEQANIEVVDLATGAVTRLDAGEADDFPVGCHAVFLQDRDEGYIFGGGSQAAGFNNRTWRYRPSDRSFTALADVGPEARYDGVLRYPVPGGPVWLIGGMGRGLNGARFYADVWQLDPVEGTWSPLPITGSVPPGRRTPWVAFSPDVTSVVMGFGSDSARGETHLSDLWRLDLATLAWSPAPIMETDTPPPPRGFAQWIPGGAGSVGVLAGGLGPDGVVEDAMVLHPAVPQNGWR